MAATHFAHVLADKLAQDMAAAYSGGRKSVRTSPLERETARIPRIPGLSGYVRGFARAFAAETAPGIEPGIKPAPVLTSEQREALSRLRELGAALEDEFDRVQLKRAFRQLALVLHPDRHPGASPRDREQLSARFGELCQAYRTLTPVGI
jgi:hypothetical protein